MQFFFRKLCSHKIFIKHIKGKKQAREISEWRWKKSQAAKETRNKQLRSRKETHEGEEVEAAAVVKGQQLSGLGIKE